MLLQIVNIHGEEREDQRNNHNQYLMFSGAGNEPNSISSKLPVEIKKNLWPPKFLKHVSQGSNQRALKSLLS